MHPTTYRSDIDGLRAIAVLPVVLFHAELGFPGGFVGVDVFFVISGYLITSLMLRDLDAGKFSLAEFWERRFRRILPALAVVMGVTGLVGAFLLLPGDVKLLGKTLAAQSVMLSNVLAWRQAGYFAPSSETIPLLHLWSLAIEEQFYLVLPMAMLLLHGRGRFQLALICGIAASVSFALSIYGAGTYTSFTFYMLPTRAWELLLGSLLCLVPAADGKQRWLAEAGGDRRSGDHRRNKPTLQQAHHLPRIDRNSTVSRSRSGDLVRNSDIHPDTSNIELATTRLDWALLVLILSMALAGNRFFQVLGNDSFWNGRKNPPGGDVTLTSRLVTAIRGASFP